MIDATAALITFLKAQAALTGLVDDRVYGPGGVPAGVTMPQQALVVLPDGIDRPLPTASIEYPLRFTFHCYGATHVEANQVYRALADALHGQGPVDVGLGLGVGSGAAYDNRLLLARQVSGPRDGLDPQLEWPRTTAGYLVWFIRDLLTAY